MDSAWLLLNRRGGALVENTQVFRFDLKVNGIGAWSGDVAVFVPSSDQVATIGKRAR